MFRERVRTRVVGDRNGPPVPHPKAFRTGEWGWTLASIVCRREFVRIWGNALGESPPRPRSRMSIGASTAHDSWSTYLHVCMYPSFRRFFYRHPCGCFPIRMRAKNRKFLHTICMSDPGDYSVRSRSYLTEVLRASNTPSARGRMAQDGPLTRRSSRPRLRARSRRGK